jgi:predicted RNA-binding Zn ribbon-like protein
MIASVAVVPRYDLPRAAEGPLRVVQLFVNSVDREHGREWFPTPQVLACWLAERGVACEGAVGDEHLARAHELRDALRSLLRANNDGEVDEAAVAIVNGAARRGRLELALDDHGHAAIRVADPGADGALARIVAIAFDAMRDGSWSRLKACRQCEWVFWDTSKNRSGSWCSMQLCGNRRKTRAYRRRKSTGALP